MHKKLHRPSEIGKLEHDTVASQRQTYQGQVDKQNT